MARLTRRRPSLRQSTPRVEFTSPFLIGKHEPITLVELRMWQFSGKIRSKPAWWEKINDPTIVAKWREEIVEHDRALVDKMWGGEDRFKPGDGEKKWPRDPITDAQINYIFAELEYAASQRDQDTGIFATAIGKIHESRSLISAELRADLVKGVATLEDVPADENDWHPGSNNQVLDLVHHHSTAYVSAPPTLHPLRHAPLYLSITSILARFIPLFERVLSDSLSADPELAVQAAPRQWYGDEEPDDDNWEEWDRLRRWPAIPDPRSFRPQPEEERVSYSLKDRKIQVIVKLANIVLTRENPKYPGGAWHVEGMANENIVATGIYYYVCENITESRLDFRTTVGTSDSTSGLPYQQSDHKGYVVAYGFGRDHALNQHLGHIVAEADKCIAFPNVYQHHVDAFELADPSKPGYRKILCFFLVNPDVPILSTMDVPPQREDWVRGALEEAPALRNLPQELLDLVTGYVKGGVISRGEAEDHRDRLMKERSQCAFEHNRQVYEVEFNMCEH
ncbi:hypothetical protein C8Q74DRAFT_1367753 [Fomes fomentarius]|nr:hypothetical protein C8Q74DRAFT_1367753 [Fomes fomentarius]